MPGLSGVRQVRVVLAAYGLLAALFQVVILRSGRGVVIAGGLLQLALGVLAGVGDWLVVDSTGLEVDWLWRASVGAGSDVSGCGEFCLPAPEGCARLRCPGHHFAA